DETSGAHPANLTGVTPAIWGKETNLRTRSLFISAARRAGPGDRERVAKMRVGLSREEPVGNSEVRRSRGGESRFLERAVRAPSAGATVRASRRRDESGELRHALRLRANRRVPNRCLDRTSLARKLFCRRT